MLSTISFLILNDVYYKESVLFLRVFCSVFKSKKKKLAKKSLHKNSAIIPEKQSVKYVQS